MKQNGTWSKVVRPGSVSIEHRLKPVFIKIEIAEGKLSISGVEGPKSNGDAWGSCGQIEMGYAHRNPAHNDRRYSNPSELKIFAPGWTRERWLDLLDIWHRWHLNDMKPNCEHQVGPDWETGKELTLYYFRRSKATEETITATEKRALACLITGETFTPLPEEVRLACLPRKITLPTPEAPTDYEPNGPQYSGDTYNKPSEVKTAGWVKPEEHPGGLLCKPCPVCGYKYGESWRREELPAQVIDFLKALPDTDQQPAWV